MDHKGGVTMFLSYTCLNALVSKMVIESSVKMESILDHPEVPLGLIVEGKVRSGFG